MLSSPTRVQTQREVAECHSRISELNYELGVEERRAHRYIGHGFAQADINMVFANVKALRAEIRENVERIKLLNR